MPKLYQKEIVLAPAPWGKLLIEAVNRLPELLPADIKHLLGSPNLSDE
jgi:hypothetical protein